MDVLDIARLQFAATASFHWLFVLLTLGLAPLVAVLQTRSVLARDPAKAASLEGMTRFWGQIYVINYVVGIVTGLVMEFQFGLNWSGLTHVMGSVFGAPLALEALIAFFAESTFLGMWIFGWGKLPKKIHLSLIWLVTLTAYASAYWILVANGFMHQPRGYQMRDGAAYLTDFGALLSNPNVWFAFAHVTAAALAAGGTLLLGVSAYHLLRRTDDAFFIRSLRLGWLVAYVGFFGAFGTGWPQFEHVSGFQPMKGVVLEPGQAAETQRQLVEQFGAGSYALPDWLGAAFWTMMGIGESASYVLLFASPLLIRRWIVRRRLFLRFLVAMVPMPFVAAIGGWVFREVGRQPWVVYGVLSTEDAVSPVGPGTMTAALVAFTTVFAVLTVVNWTLIIRFVRRGPNGAQLGAPSSESDVGPDRLADDPVPAIF